MRRGGRKDRPGGGVQDLGEGADKQADEHAGGQKVPRHVALAR